MRVFVALLTDDGGATVVEYALVVSLIAAVSISLLIALGPNVNALYAKVLLGF